MGESKAVAVALSLLVISAPRGALETIAVPGDSSDIQDALDAAADGDTVLIAPGKYVISVPLRPSRAGEPLDAGAPGVAAPATLRAAGAGVCARGGCAERRGAGEREKDVDGGPPSLYE
jgi:hypothetical protein